MSISKSKTSFSMHNLEDIALVPNLNRHLCDENDPLLFIEMNVFTRMQMCIAYKIPSGCSLNS